MIQLKYIAAMSERNIKARMDDVERCGGPEEGAGVQLRHQVKTSGVANLM